MSDKTYAKDFGNCAACGAEAGNYCAYCAARLTAYRILREPYLSAASANIVAKMLADIEAKEAGDNEI